MSDDASVGVPVPVAEDAAAVARRRGRDDPPELLRAGDNVLFRVGDTVLRVSSAAVDVPWQVALVRWLSDRGVPALCPIGDPVDVDGVFVTVWELIDGGTLIDYRQLGSAIATLHQLEPSSVAARVALPWFADASWLDFGANLDAAAETGVVSDGDIYLLRIAAEELAGWQDEARREELVVCHGYVQPHNVLMRGDELVIIDRDKSAWDLQPGTMRRC